MRLYPNGLGELTGDSLVTSTAPLYLSGAVWWVLSTIGIDAAGTAGQDRERPLATLQQAITNAADGDIIVLRDGHVQTVTAAIAVSKVLTIAAGGRSAAGLPTVVFTLNAANASLFTINTSSGVELRNILFAENQQTNANATKIDLAATGCRLAGCYFRCGATDVNQAAVRVSGDYQRLERCTFVSTAAAAVRPASGLLQGGFITTGLELAACVFDDGTFGFATQAADMDSQSTARLRALDMHLLNGAQYFSGAGATGYIGVSLATGGGEVVW